MRKYPTLWQRKTMWASLTAIFVVLLVIVVGSVIWVGVTVIAFLQPILIPVAIAAIIAYLLDPVVTHLTRHGLGRTKAVLALFTIAFLAFAALITWIVPLVSVQSVSLARQLPAFTERTRDRVVDLLYRYERTFGAPSKGGKAGAAHRSRQLVTGRPDTGGDADSEAEPFACLSRWLNDRTGADQTYFRRSAADSRLGPKTAASY